MATVPSKGRQNAKKLICKKKTIFSYIFGVKGHIIANQNERYKENFILDTNELTRIFSTLTSYLLGLN